MGWETHVQLVTRPTGGGSGGETLAGGGGETSLVVEIRVGDFVVEGKSLDAAGLKALLEKRAEAARGTPAGPSDLLVLVRAEKDTPWRRVQTVMQACADPALRIWKIQFEGGPKMYTPHKRPLQEPRKLTTLQVDVAWPGASARKIEREVTRRIEGALLTVPGLQEMDSESRAGRCEIVLVLNPGADKDETTRRVESVLERIRTHLPAGVKVVKVGDGPEMMEVPLDWPGEKIDPLKEEVKPDIEERKPIEQEPGTIKDARVSDHNETAAAPSKAAPFRVRARLRVNDGKVQINVARLRRPGQWHAIEKALEGMGPFLESCRKQSDEIEAVIEAAPEVPHAAVVKLIEAFMKGNVTEITFKGTPPRAK